MSIDKFNVNYVNEKIWNKDLFLFVNHKTAVICWALLKAEKGLVDVITFDSHRDFYGGFITQGYFHKFVPREKLLFASKYKEDDHVQHFTECKEFLNWDLLDAQMNLEIVSQKNKFLTWNNDNFIDIAFMKKIVNDVQCYYLDKERTDSSGKCDDFERVDHIFLMRSITEFQEPQNPFILDLDLDFFASLNDGQIRLSSGSKIKRYLSLIKQLGQRKDCVGITLALEPACCGSEANCLKICESVSEVFEKDIISIAKGLIKSCTIKRIVNPEQTV